MKKSWRLFLASTILMGYSAFLAASFSAPSKRKRVYSERATKKVCSGRATTWSFLAEKFASAVKEQHLDPFLWLIKERGVKESLDENSRELLAELTDPDRLKSLSEKELAQTQKLIYETFVRIWFELPSAYSNYEPELWKEGHNPHGGKDKSEAQALLKKLIFSEEKGYHIFRQNPDFLLDTLDAKKLLVKHYIKKLFISKSSSLT